MSRSPGMNGQLLGASWLAVRRAPLLAPAAAAVLLVLVTWPWLDTGHAHEIMHGLGILLACAWAGSTDDPAGEVAAATPSPMRLRAGARIAVGLGVVAPIYLAGALVAHLRFAPTPMAALVLEAAGYAVVAVALGCALRAWRGQLTPSYAASIGLLGVAVFTYVLPSGWAMVDPQTWGPPWTAATLRWAALMLLGAGVLCAALRDPAAAGQPRGRRWART